MFLLLYSNKDSLDEIYPSLKEIGVVGLVGIGFPMLSSYWSVKQKKENIEKEINLLKDKKL